MEINPHSQATYSPNKINYFMGIYREFINLIKNIQVR